MFFLLLNFYLGEARTIIMRDSDEYSGTIYECDEATTWQKFCEFRDFTSGSCRPWRLHACDEPYVQLQLSPCLSYTCEVQR